MCHPGFITAVQLIIGSRMNTNRVIISSHKQRPVRVGDGLRRAVRVEEQDDVVQPHERRSEQAGLEEERTLQEPAQTEGVGADRSTESVGVAERRRLAL